MRSRPLLALTASALALPGISGPARGDTAPAFSTLSYQISTYNEDDLPTSSNAGGSSERYDITIHQFRLVTPFSDTFALTLDSSYESMSGASPWYLVRRPDGTSGVVMSGATITEQRRDLLVNATRYLDNGSIGANLGVSRENDYESYSGGINFERHFNNNLTTVSSGFSISTDDINPSDAVLFNRVMDEDKRSMSAAVSLTQVINQTSVFQTALNLTRFTGYLTDPYKLADVRPDSRNQIAWSNAYRRFFPGTDGAFHLNYRFFDDTFGINSHTLEASWFQNIGDNLQLTPGVRYYTQSAADFYLPANDFTLLMQPQSSDYRLSAYGAISGSLSLQATIDDMQLTLSAERYLTDGSYSLFEVDEENPALVNYTRLSLGIRYQF